MRDDELVTNLNDAKEKIIRETANELKSEVQRIESKPVKSTKDNYGEYLRFMSIGTDKAVKIIIAKALIEAGANPKGVNSALTLTLNNGA